MVAVALAPRVLPARASVPERRTPKRPHAKLYRKVKQAGSGSSDSGYVSDGGTVHKAADDGAPKAAAIVDDGSSGSGGGGGSGGDNGGSDGASGDSGGSRG